MTDFTQVIAQIQNATTLTGINNAISNYSAQASGGGGVLYTDMLAM